MQSMHSKDQQKLGVFKKGVVILMTIQQEELLVWGFETETM